LGSLLYAVDRVNVLLEVHTRTYLYAPESHWFGLYTLLVRLLSSVAILSAMVSAVMMAIHPRRIPGMLANPDNIIVLFTVCCMVFLAAGEVSEEARLLLTILPCLATIAIYRSAGNEPADHSMRDPGATW